MKKNLVILGCLVALGFTSVACNYEDDFEVTQGTGTTTDTTAPTVTVTAPASVVVGQPAKLTIKFDEAVSGFEIGDIAATNGTLANFTKVSDTEYTVEYTPAAATEGTVTIAEGAVTDAAGNKNAKSETKVTATAATAPPVAIDTLPTSAQKWLADAFGMESESNAAAGWKPEETTPVKDRAKVEAKTAPDVDGKIYDVSVTYLGKEFKVGFIEGTNDITDYTYVRSVDPNTHFHKGLLDKTIPAVLGTALLKEGIGYPTPNPDGKGIVELIKKKSEEPKFRLKLKDGSSLNYDSSGTKK